MNFDIRSELCQTVKDELFLYLSYLFEFDKAQDLPNKNGQTVGDVTRRLSQGADFRLGVSCFYIKKMC
jgi:hypothetical protein